MDAISIRMEHETHVAFSEFCRSVGLSVSAAVNLFARKVVNENRIPFEISAAPRDDFWDDEATRSRLLESIAQIKAGKFAEHEPIEVSC